MSTAARRPRPYPPQPVKAILVGRGLSTVYVAEQIGVSHQTLGRLLNGIAAPHPAIAAQLASYLDLPESDLFDDRWGTRP
jgi:transcriptional regulator with XRE-family HTH domain